MALKRDFAALEIGKAEKGISSMGIRLQKKPIMPLARDRVYDLTTYGWDTETHKGKATLIAASDGNHRITEDLGDVLDILYTKRYQGKINFFFNLEYDCNAIIKHLPKANIKQLARTNETTFVDPRRDTLKKFEMIPKKMFRISERKPDGKIARSIRFFDLPSFYMFGNLEKTYNKVFVCKERCKPGKPKYCKDCSEKMYMVANGGYLKSMDASKEFPLEDINDEDIAYCIEDAQAAGELAQSLVTLANSILPCRKFYSPASLSREAWRYYLDDEMQPCQDNPMQRYGVICYAGGRFEVLQRGCVERAWMYDINSAYPYAMSRLPKDTGIYRFEKSIRDDALLSFFIIKVKEQEMGKLSYLRDYRKQTLVYPQGGGRYYMTGNELELLDRVGVDYDICKGMHMLGDYEPMFNWLKEIYDKRRILKKGGKREEFILKLIANGAYGITYNVNNDLVAAELDGSIEEELEQMIECEYCGYNDDEEDISVCPQCSSLMIEKLYKKVGDAGKFFYPMYAAYITAGARVQILDACIKHEKDVLMFATDSVTFTKKKRHIDVGEQLGQWDISKKLHGVIVGSGVYGFTDTDGRSIADKQRLRGFGHGKVEQILREHQSKKKFEFIKPQGVPLKLKEAVVQDRIDELNIFVEKHRTLGANMDTKRRWERKARSFKDLLENPIYSEPLIRGEDYKSAIPQ